MRTRDGVDYREGMTLYSVLHSGSKWMILPHPDTHLLAINQWQTHGSPGTGGYVNDCFSTYDACVKHILGILDSLILRIQKERDEWQKKSL
jgi:hypothetical protein